ncbi:hypothetical protein SCFA_120011 [anaerobic digester metagenome]|uniref:Uncharacterized protein n=1 Tax=anaerobic digester metagenome TaxID=1263854 RepID=A0A485LVW0_9ZZZZ
MPSMRLHSQTGQSSLCKKPLPPGEIVRAFHHISFEKVALAVILQGRHLLAAVSSDLRVAP